MNAHPKPTQTKTHIDMGYALINVNLSAKEDEHVDDHKNHNGKKARVLMMRHAPTASVRDTVTIFHRGFVYISRHGPDTLITEAMRIAVAPIIVISDGAAAGASGAEPSSISDGAEPSSISDGAGEINAKARILIELVRIRELGTAKGCRYGGPATLCRLTFSIRYESTTRVRAIGDGKITGRVKRRTHGYYARITEAAHTAGDTFTAMVMPLPFGH